MADDKAHFSSRISAVLVQKIKERAKQDNTSITAIVEDAFKQYFKDDLPGLCPYCHTQNNPEAQFCQKCGRALTEEAQMSVTQAEQFIKKSAVYQEVLDTIREELGLEKKDKQSE